MIDDASRDGAGRSNRNLPEATPSAAGALAGTGITDALALLRIAGRIARIGGWSLDLSERSAKWSDEVCAIHGVPAGHHPTLEQALAFYAPEWREQIAAVVERCATLGTPFDEEMEIVTAAGERLWVRAIGEPVRNTDGRVVRIQGAFQDISDRKRSEAALAGSERRFRDFADALPQIVWTAGPDGLVDFANRAFYDHVGTTDLQPLATRWIEVVHPADAEPCAARWTQSLASGLPYAVELRLRGADGAYRWHLVNATAVRDESGSIVRWYGTTVDRHDLKLAEQETRRLATRLNTTLESIGDAFFTVDRDWRFTFLNSRAEKLLLRPRDTLLGRSVWDEFPEAVQTIAYTEYRRAMAEGTPTDFEFYYQPLGTWFDVSAYPSEEGLAVYFRDVTARRTAQDALRTSEQRFRAAAHATADVIWDWDLASDAVWRSSRFRTAFGYGDDEIATNAAWSRRIHADDRARVVASLRAAIDARQEYWQEEYRFLHKDGTLIEVEDRGYLILDADGRPARFIGGMSDITARKRTHARLEQQAGLLDVAQDAIIVRDAEQRIRFWNRSAERMYGWSAEEAEGRFIGSLLYDDQTDFREATARVLQDGHYRGQLRQRRKDGSWLTVEANWTLVRSGEGESQAIFAVNTDITARLALEDQLRQSQRLETVGQLTGGIAHDFNNLLTVILGNAELLAEEVEAGHRHRHLAETVKAAAERGAELTSRLLAFARRQPLDPKVVDVNRLIAGMDGLARRTLGGAVDIEFVRAGGLWQALVDAPQLESAVLNLCVNARDAMPGGGRLTIETANTHLDDDYAARHGDLHPGQYVMVAVSDTGTGMASDVVARAFDPFFTTKPAGKGSGLGLSMVYGFAKQSQGHVKIYSEPGHGTTVRLYLPRAPQGAAPHSPQPDEAPASKGSETILVVEDDDLVREHVGAMIAGLGYRIIAASSGQEALDALRRFPAIDLMFTDVVMPGGMSGRELADAARALRPELPILFTSGYTENAIVHHGRLDPGVQLLNKPYRRSALATRLRQVLGGSRTTP